MRRIIIAIALLSLGFSQQTYDSEIQSIWDNSCTSSCHNSGNNSGGLNLMAANSYSELVNVASQGYSGLMRVKPWDPQNSVLFQKIVGNTSFGDRMPVGGTLPQADEEKIKKWIEEGARQDWSGGEYSLSFDGVDDYISQDTELPDPNGTYELWFKADDLSLIHI